MLTLNNLQFFLVYMYTWPAFFTYYIICYVYSTCY